MIQVSIFGGSRNGRICVYLDETQKNIDKRWLPFRHARQKGTLSGYHLCMHLLRKMKNWAKIFRKYSHGKRRNRNDVKMDISFRWDNVCTCRLPSALSTHMLSILPLWTNLFLRELYSLVTIVTSYHNSGGLKQKHNLSWFWRLAIQQKLTFVDRRGYHQDHTLTSLEAPSTPSLSLLSSNGYYIFWLVTTTNQTPLMRSKKSFLFYLNPPPLGISVKTTVTTFGAYPDGSG